MNSNTQALYHDISLPGYTTSGNIFLAPLAGFTDPPFRSMCIDHGVSLCWSEMVSAEAAARGSEKTEMLMRRARNEKDLVIQVFLSHYSQILRALPVILKYSPVMIDINCGCPVPKVIKTGAGSALMLKSENMADIVKALTGETSIPVSVKFRSGWDHDSISFLSFARLAEEAGASLLTLHPRTRSQGYSGKADYSMLKELSEQAGVPVIGSGDADSPEKIRGILTETGVDGVMVGRGAVGNPFIFSQARALLEGKPLETPSLEEIYRTVMKHLDIHIEEAGEYRACREMRKQVCAYTKGLPGSAQLRNEIVHARTREEYQKILKESLLFGHLDHF